MCTSLQEGPNSFQPTPAIAQTVHELGITKDLVLANAALPRFVYWEGLGSASRLANLHALPTNLPGDLFTFGLLTWPGRIRAALGAIGVIAPSKPLPYEESVREFVTRHLGEETFERIIDPFVSGVYAGDPDYLAMRSALKKIHRLEGLGDFGPGLVSGAINRFKEIDQDKKDNPAGENVRAQAFCFFFFLLIFGLFSSLSSSINIFYNTYLRPGLAYVQEWRARVFSEGSRDAPKRSGSSPRI